MMRTKFFLSLKEIGELLKRDYSTIISSLKRVEKTKENDQDFAQLIRMISQDVDEKLANQAERRMQPF